MIPERLKHMTPFPLAGTLLALCLILALPAASSAAPPAFSKAFSPDSIFPGDVSTLTFTIDNSGQGTILGVNFTDNLPAGMVIATPSGAVDGCGGILTASAGSNVITFLDPSLPGVSCTISVDVTSSTVGDSDNVTSDLLSTAGSSGFASATLTVDPLPAFSMVFDPDPIFVDGTATLTFTVDNTAAATAITSVAFTDTLPAGMVIATPNGAVDGCGGSLTAIAGNDAVTYSGGTLGAGASCTVAVDVTSSVPGSHVNTSGDLTSSAGNSGSASDTLDVDPLPAFSKVFDPDPIFVDGTATLTFTVDNSGADAGITNVAFTDTMPAGLLIATPNGAVDGCGGTLSAVPGTGIVTYSGGSTAAMATCTVSVDVTSSVPGSHVNTSGDLTSSAGNSGPASDTLDVQPLPIFSKEFSPDSIIEGGTSTLTFTVDNSGAGTGITSVAFTDTMPAGMVIATPSGAGDDCGGTLTATAGSDTVTYTVDTLGAGGSCTVVVDVTSSVPGSHVNTSGDLTSSAGNSGPASDTLTVDPLPVFAKVFSPDSIFEGGMSTLTFTVDNSGATAITSVAFTDTMPAGMVIATPSGAGDDCGGTLTATAGSDTVTYTVDTLGAGGSCTVDVDVTSSVPGSHINISGEMTSSAGNSGTATDTLTVDPLPAFSKEFIPDWILPGGATTTLRFTVANSSASAITGIAFTDTMPAGMLVVAPFGADDCGGSLTAIAGSNTITYTGGTLGAGASCTVAVDVTSSVPGSHVNTSGDLTSSAGNSGPASDTLTVDPPPTFAKAFSPDSISEGSTSTLTFTVDNSGARAGISAVAFTDTMPAGMVIAAPSGAVDSCGGSLTAIAGSDTVTYSGGSAAALGSCSVSVEVTSSVPGSHENTSGSLTSSSGNSGPASDTLTVLQVLPTFSKAFSASPIFAGGTSTLTFTVDNSASMSAATSLAFDDILNRPQLILDATGDGAGNTLLSALGVAVDGAGNLYVTGGASDNAFKITPGGTITEIIDATGDGAGNTLDGPFGVAVDGAGNVYVTGTASDNAFKITPSGTITEIIDATGDGEGNNLNTPLDVAVDGAGNVYVAGLASNNAFKITTGSVITEIIDATGDGAGGNLARPQRVTTDGSGNVYVTGGNTHNMFEITTGGVITEIIDATGDGAGNTLGTPFGVAVDGAGNVYVTGQSSNNAFKITTGGSVSEIISGTGDGAGNVLIEATGVAVDGSGNVYVTGANSDNVFQITPMGVVTEVIDGAGDGSGSALAFPFFVAVGSEDVYVTGQSTSNVFRLTPGAVVIATPNGAVDGCGGTLAASPGTGAVTYTGGSVAAGASCTVSVDVTGSGAGSHINISGELTSSAGTSSTANDTLDVNPLPPAFSKAFSPDSIFEDGTSTLTFTIDNSAAAAAITSVAFTDILPTGMVIATPNSAGDDCGGSLTATAGSGTVTYSGGSVAAGASCTISVDVTSSVVGSHLNTSGDLTSSAGNSGPASDTLTVHPLLPTFAKTFSPDSIFEDGTSTLTFTIDNSASMNAVTSLAFDDILNRPQEIIDHTGDGANILEASWGIAVDDANNVYVGGFSSDNVFRITPGGTITEIIDETGDGTGNNLDGPRSVAVDGSGNVYVTGSGSDNAFKITPGGTITEIIDATGDGAGNTLDRPSAVAVDGDGNVYVAGLFSNNAFKITTGSVITEIIDATGDGAGGNLARPLGITVDGSGNVYVTGGNTHNAFEITTGGVITEIIDATGDGVGNTLSTPFDVAVDGAGNVYVTGPSSNNAFKITTGGSVSEIINGTGDGAGNVLIETTGVAVDGSGNVYVTGAGSDNVFQITPMGVVTEVIDGAGDGSGRALESPFSVTVGSENVYVTSLSISNVFQLTPGAVVIATPNGDVNGCGGTLSAVSGTGAVTYTGGSVAAGASCTVSVDVTSSVAGSHVNISGELTSSAGNSGTASDTLTVDTQVELTLTKTDSADPVTAGSGPGNLVYTITVGNLGPSAATGLTLSEVLTVPAGVVIESIVPSGSTTYPAGPTNGTWTVGTLTAGASVSLTVTLSVGASTAPGVDVISDTVTVTQVNEANVGATSVHEATSVVTLADLVISKIDSRDPVAAGDALTYTITVFNSSGPSDATAVQVTETLPTGVTFVQTSGCDNDPAGVPTCDLGTIAAGAMQQYTVEVSVDPATDGIFTNHVSVASDTPEAVPADNTTSEDTTADNLPPTVTLVHSVPDTGDGELAECEEARVDLSQLLVTFSEPMQDPAGDTGAIDVTNPASYLLVASGPDNDFATSSCAGVAGDDQAVVIDAVAYSEPTATLSVNGGRALRDSLYRLLVCSSSVRDLAGNALDGNGDGTSGDELVRTYRVARTNIFLNGNFDCALDPWVTVPLFSYSMIDVDTSGVSGSATFSTASDTGASLGQCSPASPGPYRLSSSHSVTSSNPELTLRMICEYFSTTDCTGASLGFDQIIPGLDLTGIWESTMLSSAAPAGSLSTLCSVDLQTLDASEFEAFFDEMSLIAVLFADGFESGDTSAWTATMP